MKNSYLMKHFASSTFLYTYIIKNFSLSLCCCEHESVRAGGGEKEGDGKHKHKMQDIKSKRKNYFKLWVCAEQESEREK